MKTTKVIEMTSFNIPMKLFHSIGKLRPQRDSVQRKVESRQDEEGEEKEEEEEWKKSFTRYSLLCKPLLPFHKFLAVAGLGPHTYNPHKGLFEINWTNITAIHTLVNFVYLSALMTVTALCVIWSFLDNEKEEHHEDESVKSIKLIGLVILCGYQLNAWVQVLNAIFSAPRLCRLLNTWNQLGSTAGIDPTKGVYRKACIQVGFMILFILGMMVVAVIGRPTFVTLVLDSQAENMYLIPRAWLTSWEIYRKIIHVIVCFVALHQFAINKGSVFAFTTHCHFLETGIISWNTLLSQALEDIWEKGSQNCLSSLLESRRKLVQMVRLTERVYSPVLQCYFATTVVVVCTELYLLAHRMGDMSVQVDEIIILILFTTQTSFLMVHVSLAAGSVQEQAEASADVLMRGLPHTASELDKFYMGELTRSISIVNVYITGGNFFTVNRSFILTVVSVVASYFIVIMQFMQSCKQSDQHNYTKESNETDIQITALL